MTHRFEAIKRGHQHAEAFCLMWYQCRKCHHLERIWNSRDGVTPFGTDCPSCGEDVMNHVAFGSDQYAPQHQLHYGQKFWRDGTPDEAEAIIRRRIERCRGTAYQLAPERAAELVAHARDQDGEHTEFRRGWPILDIHKPNLVQWTDAIYGNASEATKRCHTGYRAAAEIETFQAALVRIGEQARDGGFTDHGECPATFACSAIVAELIDLGMPPEGVTEDEPTDA